MCSDPLYQLKMQYGQSPYSNQLTPDYEMRFNQIDVDRSGTISGREISQLYSFSFNEISATQLIRAICDRSELKKQDFPLFDTWMMTFYRAFYQFAFNGEFLPSNYVSNAIGLTKLTTTPYLLDFITRKYARGGDGSINFGQFLSVCSYILLCGRIMQKFDKSNSGKLCIDYYGLQSLGLWFV